MFERVWFVNAFVNASSWRSARRWLQQESKQVRLSEQAFPILRLGCPNRRSDHDILLGTVIANAQFPVILTQEARGALKGRILD